MAPYSRGGEAFRDDPNNCQMRTTKHKSLQNRFTDTSLFQALGLWGRAKKAGERGKDERGRRRARAPTGGLTGKYFEIMNNISWKSYI